MWEVRIVCVCEREFLNERNAYTNKSDIRATCHEATKHSAREPSLFFFILDTTYCSRCPQWRKHENVGSWRGKSVTFTRISTKVYVLLSRDRVIS